MENANEKSRKERRKDARLAKNKKKFDSWVQKQTKRSSLAGSKENQKKLPKVKAKNNDTVRNPELADSRMNPATERNHSERKQSSKKRSRPDKRLGGTQKTKFFDYLQREMDGDKMLAEEDIAIERRLAKKLKLKNGRLGMGNDDLGCLLEGIPSALDKSMKTQEVHKPYDTASPEESDDANSLDEDLEDEIWLDDSDDNNNKYSGDDDDDDEDDGGGSDDDDKNESQDTTPSSETNDILEGDDDSDTNTDNFVEPMKKETSNGTLGKYVAPHLRSRTSNESGEYVQMRNKLRGILGKLSITNLEETTRNISSLFSSIGHGAGSEIISEEVVSSYMSGSVANEQYAAVLAAFVAGMSCSVGIELGAKLLSRLAKFFEEQYMKEVSKKITLFLSYLYVAGVCSSELIYDFLIMLGKRLTEVDTSNIVTVLQCCGMKLRGDDPVGMKTFISNVQIRANEIKASAGDGKSNTYNTRVEHMIQTINDIKNNRQKTKEDPLQHNNIKNWLQKLRIEDITLRGLNWQKLLDPNRKGQWWLSADMGIASADNNSNLKSSFNQENHETMKMLEIAASQGMNTDSRRAIFCVIMFGAEDPVDAFESLLRLKLPGKQDREMMRVLVHCCLEEKVFNKYFSILASKLCSFDRHHKASLQYCLWDHFKELDNMPLRKSVNLSEFTAEMIASFSLSLTLVKVVDLDDPSHLTSKKAFHFGLLFKKLLEYPDELVSKIFARITVLPNCEPLRNGIEFFIKEYVLKDHKSLAKKFQLARRALKQC